MRSLYGASRQRTPLRRLPARRDVPPRNRSAPLLEDPLPNPSSGATILIVCTANVCRSPLAEFVLREALTKTPGFEAIRVASAGVQAVRGGRICELVLASHGAEGWSDFAEQHRSRSATSYELSSAKLVLTASTASRAAVAALDPAGRSRTFTMREALWLNGGFETETNGALAVEAFAKFANSRRGRLAVPAQPRMRLPWSRGSSDPLSITDGHNGDERQHRATIREVIRSAGSLARLIGGAGLP